MSAIGIIGDGLHDDPCAVRVAAALRARGRSVAMVDTADFPGPLQLAVGPDGVTEGFDASVVLLRALRPGASLPASLPPDQHAACVTQASAALQAWLEVSPARMVNPLHAPISRSSLLWMLRRAAAHGLDTPRTLMSNDAQAVRAFATGCPAGVICKLIDSGVVTLATEDGPESFPTTLLSPDDLADLSGLSISPMIFQERLLKRRELRILWVAGELFVGAIEPGEVIDWRTERDLIGGFQVFDGLPPEVAVGLHALLRELEADIASVDVIQTPDDRWVFLEVNGLTWWDHLEDATGLPISEAVAAHLDALSAAARR